MHHIVLSLELGNCIAHLVLLLGTWQLQRPSGSVTWDLATAAPILVCYLGLGNCSAHLGLLLGTWQLQHPSWSVTWDLATAAPIWVCYLGLGNCSTHLGLLLGTWQLQHPSWSVTWDLATAAPILVFYFCPSHENWLGIVQRLGVIQATLSLCVLDGWVGVSFCHKWQDCGLITGFMLPFLLAWNCSWCTTLPALRVTWAICDSKQCREKVFSECTLVCPRQPTRILLSSMLMCCLHRNRLMYYTTKRQPTS